MPDLHYADPANDPSSHTQDPYRSLIKTVRSDIVRPCKPGLRSRSVDSSASHRYGPHGQLGTVKTCRTPMRHRKSLRLPHRRCTPESFLVEQKTNPERSVQSLAELPFQSVTPWFTEIGGGSTPPISFLYYRGLAAISATISAVPSGSSTSRENSDSIDSSSGAVDLPTFFGFASRMAGYQAVRPKSPLGNR